MKTIILKALILLLALFVLKAQEHHGINLEYMDTSVKPQDDFYNYTNGSWMKSAEIPSDRSRWGSFDELREYTDSVSLNILKKSFNQKFSKGDDLQKVADLYSTYTDWRSRNKVGLTPLQEYFADIDKIKNLEDLQTFFTKNTPIGGNDLYGFYVHTNMKKSKENALYLTAPSLGMGRDYYQKTDESSLEALKKYMEYLHRLQELTQMKISTSPEEVVEFEKKMASFLKTVVERRDSKKRYNPVAVKDLKNMVKSVDLEAYLKHFKIEKDTIIIPEIKYYQQLDEVLNEENLALIKDYLKFSAANGMSGSLNQELDELNFDFYSKTLRGQKEQRSMDKRGLSVVNRNIGEVLGKLYVAEVFPPEAKENAKMMVDYLVKSFGDHIQNLEWMSAETKVKAMEKLSKFTVKIGYPDKWKDYSGLQIASLKEGATYYDNVLSISIWRFYDNLKDLNEPVDKSRWGMSPQTVNAYFNSTNNEIVFPAAILQPPFYDFKADMAVNFGGIGAVIGHEISHGFDDSGSQYNGDGNIEDWWTEEDAKKFAAAGEALAKQYDAYEPLPGVFVNGKFTLGENIADLGGVSVSYDALRMYLKDHGNPGKIDGFTPEQRFYLSWATVWRSKYTDEAIKNQVKTDPHSPGYYRAFGPLINQEGFNEAFGIKEGDEMFKKDKIIIW